MDIIKYIRARRFKKEIELKNYIKFNNINEASNWGNKNYNEIPDENVVLELEQYCGYSFNPINAVLRNEDISWYGGLKFENLYRDKAKRIQSWISKFELSEDIIVYRAISKKHLYKMKLWSKEKFGDSKNILYEYGFLSTSLVFTELIKLHPDSIYFKIYLLKGTKGAYIDHISKRYEEQEFLIPPGVKLYILKISKGTYTCVLMQE